MNQQQTTIGNGTGPPSGGQTSNLSSSTFGTATVSSQQTNGHCHQGNSSQNSSEIGNNTTGNQNSKTYANKTRICRDFVRGTCRRKSCRYPHVLSAELIVFCHDYQNSSCSRINCKFLHYTLQEAEYYRKFGEFPQFDGPPQQNGCGLAPPSIDGQLLVPPPSSQKPQQQQQQPKDNYLPPFRNHPNRSDGFLGGSGPNGFDSNHWNDHLVYRSNERLMMPINAFHQCDEFQGNGSASMKRPTCEIIDSTTNGGIVSFKRYRDDSDRVDLMQVIRRFEEEQAILRRRVEANEIKIAELRASNEYLMAQVRLNNQQCSSVVNPVTVTQTSTQPPPQQTGPPQVIGGVSIAPVTVQATPIVSIAAPQTQIITANSTPIAIAAASTSQGQQQIAIAAAQQNIASLSQSSQQLQTTHTQQILGTSQITLGPALTSGPSMGLTINTSQATALAMSNATSQPIISYPVMTHSILPH